MRTRGALKWHFQFTPNDAYDYDSVQVPVLADMDWQGKPAKLMMWANRNGYFYVLDRATGRFLLGEPFVKVNWASGLDPNGPPDPDAAAARHADVAGQPGRHQLVSARRSVRARGCSISRPGKTTRRSTVKRSRNTCRAAISSAAASRC